MNYKYKLGDKFINLVKNDREEHDIGDLLTITRLDTDEPHQPYGLTKNDDRNTLWWFAETSIEEFLVPADSFTEHDRFQLLLSGRLPGRMHYHLTFDDTEVMFRSDPEELEGKIDQWKIHYFYWDRKKQ